MPRQYLNCTFKPGGKIYVYHNDGEPVLPGDEAKVPDPRGEPGDWLRVHVVEVLMNAPAFETRPILGRINV